MNKGELIAAMAEKTGMTKKDSEKALAAAFESITKALAKGEKVQVFGFGTFEVKKRAARTGINPRTGEKMKFPASKNPAFKAAKALKDTVNKKK